MRAVGLERVASSRSCRERPLTITKAMRKMLLMGSVIFPLLVTAAAFKWFPRSDLLGPVVISSAVLGWIGVGFSPLRKWWLKALILVAYPFVMWIAITLVMIVVYGIPGL